MHQFMDTMSYSQMMSMVDLISKWVLLAFGGMDLVVGGLDLIFKRDNLKALLIMIKMCIVHISYLIMIGGF